jgi:TonB-dependent SusC/RagA subfamily outer membrane receptor
MRRGFCAAAAAAAVLGGSTAPAHAQELGELSGRVTYSVNGRAIPGALVFLPGVSLGVITNAEGEYRIEGVPAGSHTVTTTLMGCMVSARDVAVQAGRRLAFDVSLAPPVIDLEGLVVTALSNDPTSTVVVERLNAGADAGSARSVGSLIQGKLPGVRVMQGSGQPGTDPSIQLRSPTSIVIGSGPLIVVDGVITQGRFSDIDPLDIDHVEVRKGAAAAAMYGSRGQAGVIEITTKRGIARGSAPRPAQSGPMLLVDGVVRNGALADVIATEEIVEIRKIEGAVAAVLYGRQAEVGLIDVITTSGMRTGPSTIQPMCLNPGL